MTVVRTRLYASLPASTTVCADCERALEEQLGPVIEGPHEGECASCQLRALYAEAVRKRKAGA